MLYRIDEELAEHYGAYASYSTPDDPIAVETYGDDPSGEVCRLLEHYTTPLSRVLDVGCGAGHTLCRIAPQVRLIWGVDKSEDLLSAARMRVKEHGLQNVSLLLADVTRGEAVSEIPDNTFTFAFSRRGPGLTEALMPKLTPDAFYVEEVVGEQDGLGLNELFGRRALLPHAVRNSDWLINLYASLGLLPVSSKTYWYELFFRDADHLEAYLRRGRWLSNWWMPPKPYEAERDRPALEIYVRYNTEARGVRLLGQRKLYVFRRAEVDYYPVDRCRL